MYRIILGAKTLGNVEEVGMIVLKLFVASHFIRAQILVFTTTRILAFELLPRRVKYNETDNLWCFLKFTANSSFFQFKLFSPLEFLNLHMCLMSPMIRKTFSPALDVILSSNLFRGRTLFFLHTAFVPISRVVLV